MKMAAMKSCPRCNETKDESCFGIRSGGKYLRSWCKACEVASTTEYQKCRGIVRKGSASRTRRYREKHPDKAAAAMRDVHARGRDELKDWYVLTAMGAKKGSLPRELIQLKREGLSLHRSLRILKQAIDGDTNDGNGNG